jgi:hypothetical protein
MLGAAGFAAGGIRAGSLAAALQSAGAGGVALAPVVVTASTVLLAGFAVATGVVVVDEYVRAQENTLGRGDPADAIAGGRATRPWVIVWENWGHGVFFRAFASREEASSCAAGGATIRRMIVRLTSDGREIENAHGQRNPWTEDTFLGSNPLADNTLRRRLRSIL